MDRLGEPAGALGVGLYPPMSSNKWFSDRLEIR